MINAPLQILGALPAIQQLNAHFAKWATFLMHRDFANSAPKLSLTANSAPQVLHVPYALIVPYSY